MKYRFKTEKEFIIEFGSDWKTVILPNWNPNEHMDFLFGTEVTEEIFKRTEEIFERQKRFLRYKNWIISRDMLTYFADTFFPPLIVNNTINFRNSEETI